MLAPSPTPADRPPLVTEAESVTRILADMDVTIAVRVSDLGEELFFDVGRDAPIGSTCLIKLARNRFINDHQFRQDMIDEASATGYILSDRPGIDGDLKTAPAPNVVDALANAGVDVLLQQDKSLPWARPTLAFQIRAEDHVADNAHLLMQLVDKRHEHDSEFAGQLADYLAIRDDEA